jgi:MFS family permease
MTSQPMMAHSPSVVKRNVLLLSSCLALSMTGSSLVMVVTALTGIILADNPAYMTLALTAQFVATMSTTIPASLLMRAVGRRIGFTIGQIIGIIAALVSCYAVFQGDFWLFVFGGALIGVHNAFWQYFRFAAADSSPTNFKAKAVSLVMAGGVISALFGPTLAKMSRDFFDPIMFAGSYAIVAILCCVTIVLLQFIRIPEETKEQKKQTGRPLSEIIKQPKFIVALFSAMIGYATMSLIMVATSPSMIICGYDFNDTANVIQSHALGMFAPSFFTGNLIKKFGAYKIIITGALLNFVCIAVNLSGIELSNFYIALIALGVGWNFMFIGGTSLLTESYEPSERSKVQAFNDFCVFGLVSVASYFAGSVQASIGWAAVNKSALPGLIIVLLGLSWLAFHQVKKDDTA